MNNNYFLFFDIETSGLETTDQILSIGSVVVDPVRLSIIPNSEFYTVIKPENPDIIEDKTWSYTGLSLQEVMKGPKIDNAISLFSEYIKRWRRGKTGWDSPIPAGYNINKFDTPFLTAKGLNTDLLFHKVNRLDLMDDMFRWTFFTKDYSVTSLNDLRDLVGLSRDGAHNALIDARDCAKIAIRLLKVYKMNKVKFERAFSNGNTD